jgi:hypothetical protein
MFQRIYPNPRTCAIFITKWIFYNIGLLFTQPIHRHNLQPDDTPCCGGKGSTYHVNL